MVSKAGSKKLKRQMAPMFWGITRKDKRFVVTVKPGSHPKNNAIPTAVLLRDNLKLVTTLREAKSAIYAGKVLVDGHKRKSLHHPIGLMDVVEFAGMPDAYRLVPQGGLVLKPIKIGDTEKTKKIVKVTSKTSLSKGRNQTGFHDGRTIISDVDVKIGDSCLMQIPEQKILDVIKLEAGSQVLVIKGINAGKIGIVDEIKEGTFILPKRVLVTLDERKIEIPQDIVMSVGKDKPVIQIR